MLNLVSKYSRPCKHVKIIPNITVYHNIQKQVVQSPIIILWCLYVTVAPEVNRTKVFKRGISIGFKGSRPIGGHTPPPSILGDNLLWK